MLETTDTVNIEVLILHYQAISDSPGNKMSKLTYYTVYDEHNHVHYTLALYNEKSHVIFGSFVDIRENAEWSRLFGLRCRSI